MDDNWSLWPEDSVWIEAETGTIILPLDHVPGSDVTLGLNVKGFSKETKLSMSVSGVALLHMKLGKKRQMITAKIPYAVLANGSATLSFTTDRSALPNEREHHRHGINLYSLEIS